MKHLMLILTAMLMPVMLLGQQKLIEDAMRNRHRGDFCQVQNTSVILGHDELQSYCQQKGYYLRGEKTRRDRWFSSITYFEILPKDEVDIYIYTNKCEFEDKPSFDALSTTGKGWFFTYLGGEQLDDIKWSGTVQNGLINGKGTGYSKKGQDCYFVTGEFVDGFPKGEVVFDKYSYSNYFDMGHISSSRITFGEMNDGMAWAKRAIDKKYSFVSADGKYVVMDKYEQIIQPFRNGRAEVVMNYGSTDSETNCSSCSGRGTVAGCSSCGGDGYTGWSNDERCKTCNGKGTHKCSACNGTGRVKVVGLPIYKEIVIDKNGKFVDYNDHQKAMDEEVERERQRIQDSLDCVAQRIQDSLDCIRLEAEEKKAELERLVAINCDHKLWSKGDHVCYVLPDGSYAGKLTCGTLEEWNENHSKAQIKIVTSPSNYAKYNGELLQKNNTFWISTQGTKWHLALEGEFEESLKYDNSEKGPDVIYKGNDNECTECNGAGKRTCSLCHGKGHYYHNGSLLGLFDGDRECERCYGSGLMQCPTCRGTGKKLK
ncbi:MAG: hypothetical protein J6T96_00720 [Bacteroidales bacterium]|nr:hypothetical protein [Bacteroidales bacterium]